MSPVFVGRVGARRREVNHLGNVRRMVANALEVARAWQVLWQLSTVESLVKPMIAGGCCKGLPELFVDVMRSQRAAGMVLNLRNRIKSQGATASENEAKDAVLVLSCLICNLMNEEAGVIELYAPSLRKAAVRARLCPACIASLGCRCVHFATRGILSSRLTPRPSTSPLTRGLQDGSGRGADAVATPRKRHVVRRVQRRRHVSRQRVHHAASARARGGHRRRHRPPAGHVRL